MGRSHESFLGHCRQLLTSRQHILLPQHPPLPDITPQDTRALFLPRKEKYKLGRGKEEQDKKAQAGCEQERTFLDLGRGEGGGGGPSPKLKVSPSNKQLLPKLHALRIFFISLGFPCDLLPENTALYINSPEEDEVREGNFWNDHIKDSKGDVEFAEEGLLILLRLESKLRSHMNKCVQA